jgi:mannose/fructose/N-acetylgalactosamine-specific phosphotransferase system component IID
MDRLRKRDLWRMASRTLLLQAGFNYERQQGLGWAWALQPALERLYPDPRQRQERLAEHTAYFNTQPTLASLALGAVARLEEQRAAGGTPDAEAMTRIKCVLGAALAALGDRLYWFTLRPFVACLGVLLVLAGSWLGAVALWACYNLFHLGVRFLGVGWGYRAGTAVLEPRLRARFDRLTETIALSGAVLAGVTTAWLLAPAGQPQPVVFEAVLVAGLGLGFVVGLKPRPSVSEWALGAGVLCVAAAWLR